MSTFVDLRNFYSNKKTNVELSRNPKEKYSYVLSAPSTPLVFKRKVKQKKTGKNILNLVNNKCFNINPITTISQQNSQERHKPTIFKFQNNIPSDSPIYKLQFLKRGWDGYWAYPFSTKVLSRANYFWCEITKNNSYYPFITPNGNGSIAFTWTHFYPEKELEIWIFDQLDYYAEWLIFKNGKEIEGSASSFLELLSIFNQYWED